MIHISAYDPIKQTVAVPSRILFTIYLPPLVKKSMWLFSCRHAENVRFHKVPFIFIAQCTREGFKKKPKKLCKRGSPIKTKHTKLYES